MISTFRRWLIMGILSFSGGIIFALPFLQEIYYIPLAEALELNNTQVGSLMSVFGITAMLSYFPGGWLADRVSPRKLITLSLLSTGVLGFYFSTFPSYQISLAIHAFWGVSITFLFWGAMIRITRNWAPAAEQGRAFGILEAGRGLGEVLPAMATLAVFAVLGSGEQGLAMVVIQYSGVFVLLGIVAWFVLEDRVDRSDGADEKPKVGLKEVIQVLKMPVVWLISIVILTGYCAYWGLFRYTPLATDVFALSVTIGATIAVGKMWFKVFIPLISGYLGDKFGIAKAVAWLFFILILNYVFIAFLPGKVSLVPLMFASLALGSIAVYAMRGIYFALLEEGHIPMAVTATAAGVISAVGFTPDIFMPLLGGVLLDNYPGELGYRYFFLTTAAICCIGLVATLIIYFKIVKKSPVASQCRRLSL
ncbi:MAG: MFS transporter [Proteobacteria bacterium]|nr:MFS transporter [Pseudomonadota bacterium]